MNALQPQTLSEALQMKREQPDASPLAGGTDVVPGWAVGNARPATLLVLSGVPELRAIEAVEGGLRIGATASHASLAAHAGVCGVFPALAAAAACIGAPAVRNMGTIGGNLVTASPAADLPPALLAYGAEVLAASAERGERRIPLDRFFVEYRTTALEPDELLVAVDLRTPPDSARAFFQEVGARRAQACSKASVAAYLRVDGGTIAEARVAAGSVAPMPVRLPATEAALAGQALTVELAAAAGRVASAEVTPIDDVRSTAEYRRHVVGGLLERFLLSQI